MNQIATFPNAGLNEHEVAMLRQALRHGYENLGQPLPVHTLNSYEACGALGAKGFGSIDGNLKAGNCVFAPNARATGWLRNQPLSEIEAFVLCYFGCGVVTSITEYRDPQIAFSEFCDAAFGLHIRDLGRYHPNAKGSGKPYFDISDAGQDLARSLQGLQS
jgi:hypothetical protein